MQSRHFYKEQRDFLLTSNRTDDCQALSLTGKKNISESSAGEISHWIWLSKHSGQPQGRSLNNKEKDMKILYFFWLEKKKVCHQKTLATAINWHYWHFLTLAFLTAFLPPHLFSLVSPSTSPHLIYVSDNSLTHCADYLIVLLSGLVCDC